MIEATPMSDAERVAMLAAVQAVPEPATSAGVAAPSVAAARWRRRLQLGQR